MLFRSDGALPAKPVLVRTVTSAEVGELIAKPAGIDAAARGQAEREALKDWIRDAAGPRASGGRPLSGVRGKRCAG